MYYLLTYIHDFYNLHLQVLNLVCKQQTRTGRRMTNHQFAIHRHLLLRPSCCQITTPGLRPRFNLFLCGLENLIDVNKDQVQFTMADDKTFPCCKDLFRLSECIRVPTNRLQHWSIRKQPPCLSGKTGPETRTYVPSSFRVQNIRLRQSFSREWHMISHSARYIRWSANDKG